MLDEIRRASEIGWTKDVSILDTVLEACWCGESDLNCAYQAITSEEEDSAIVFFQLPFLIQLPNEWIQIQTKYTNVKIRFRSIGTPINELNHVKTYGVKRKTDYKSVETFTNACLPVDSYGILVRTQTMMLYRLWGPRQNFYQRYLDALERAIHTQEKRAIRTLPRLRSAQLDTLVVDSASSWLTDARPLTALRYELDLAHRLRDETLAVLKNFLPQYAIACKDPYVQIPNYLSGFFVMVKSGRLVVPGPGKSLLAQHVRPFEFVEYSENLTNLQTQLKTGKKPTVYEEYLLESIREVDRGAYNLAVVQSVMVLEWFANEMIKDRLVSPIIASVSNRPNIAEFVLSQASQDRTRLHEKFRKQLHLAGIKLSKNTLQQLKVLFELRNHIIHRDQVAPLDRERAMEAVNLAMSVVRESMNSVQKEKGAVVK